MDASKMHCRKCRGSGNLQTHDGQIYPCPNCDGTGQASRPEVSPYDYVVPYTIGASLTVQVSIQILTWDFLLKWLIVNTATPTDTVSVQDNNSRTWMNAPVQLANFAGSGQLPFPMQPNWLQKKNTTLQFTFAGANGDTGELVLRGINLADGDMPSAPGSNG